MHDLRESHETSPSEEREKALKREAYHAHDRELSNPDARRRFEDQPPELDVVQKQLLDQLVADGLAVVPFTELFDNGLWSRLAEDSAEFVEHAREQVERKTAVKVPKPPKPGKPGKPAKPAKPPKPVKPGKTKFMQIRQFKGEPGLVPGSPWLELASSSRLLDVVNTYLGMWSKVSYVDEWYTTPSSSEADRIGSQQWHRDYNDQHLVKAFVYMMDVDQGAGPLEYVPGSARGGPYSGEWPWEPLGETYPPSDEFERRIPASAQRTLTGPKGTLFLCNTSGFHRGGFATERARVVGVLNYVSPAALASFVTRNFDLDESALGPEASEAARFAFSPA